MMNKRDIPTILGLFFVAFLIRANGLAHVAMYGDEWLYWLKTNMILANDWAPTPPVLQYSNPFLSYLGALVTLLLEGKLNVLRIIPVLFGSLTVPVLYLFGKVMYDQKTGILAALLLCFSAYHSLFSRLYMLEALTLFFITAFLYFFWLSQRGEVRKHTDYSYAITAGAMLGLAIDAKYIALFLVPSVLIYVLWTGRLRFKALLDKKLLLMFIFALLFFSPLLISLYTTGVGLEPIYFQAIGRFQEGSLENIRVMEYTPSKLLLSGVGNILGVVARGAEILPLPWADLFLASAILLLVITLLSYLPRFITREKRGSFLTISFFTLYIILLGCARHQHYLIYCIPFYFVMLAHLTVTSIDYVKRTESDKKPLRIIIVSLSAVLLFFYFVTGATSPFWDEGNYYWTHRAVEYIERDVALDSFDEHFMIGTTTSLREPIDYPVYLSGLNASTFRILWPASEYSGERATIDLERIKVEQPRYIVTSEPFYEYYFTEHVKREIFKDYKIAFHAETDSSIKARNRFLHSNYDCLVLKRIDTRAPEVSPIESPELTLGGEDGEISRDIFNASVPQVMKVGKSYTVLVQVRNTGNSCTNFTASVYSNGYTIFVQDPSRRFTLDEGSIRLLKFKILPLCEYRGELPITVDLFVHYDGEERYRKKVDSFIDYVQLIER